METAMKISKFLKYHLNKLLKINEVDGCEMTYQFASQLSFEKLFRPWVDSSTAQVARGLWNYYDDGIFDYVI